MEERISAPAPERVRSLLRPAVPKARKAKAPSVVVESPTRLPPVVRSPTRSALKGTGKSNKGSKGVQFLNGGQKGAASSAHATLDHTRLNDLESQLYGLEKQIMMARWFFAHGRPSRPRIILL